MGKYDSELNGSKHSVNLVCPLIPEECNSDLLRPFSYVLKTPYLQMNNYLVKTFIVPFQDLYNMGLTSLLLLNFARPAGCS
jgi:hypothetical protein